MTEKEKIRLWAKGRLFEVMNGIGEQDAKSVLTDLISFLGSELESDLTHSVTKISDQEIPISDDIEKEADICWDYVFSALGWDENSFMTMNHKEFLAFASHFADWQKQQVMKDAVNGIVHHFGDDEIAAVHYNDPKGVPMSYFVSSKGLNAGDKVKLIIIKEG